MKNYNLIAVLSLIVIAIFGSYESFGQNSKVTTAHFALAEGKDYLNQENYEKAAQKLSEAKDNIEEAIKNEKTMINAKTWNYRGDIYSDMMRLPAENNGGVDKMDAARLAIESYQKTIELDDSKRADYGSLAKKNMNGVVYVLIFNEGIQMINQENATGAIKAFELALLINPKDTNAAINAAIAAERIPDKDKAFVYYQKMVDEMGSNDHYAYIAVANYYTVKEDYDKALEYVQRGIKANENAKKEKMKDLLLTEFNIYLKSNRLDEAISNVKKNIEADPQNDGLYSRLGQLYDQMREAKGNDGTDYGSLAIENYNKAIELNTANLDANYNLGAFYYNKAAEIYKTVNNMDLKTYQSKGTAMEKEGEGYFNKAIPYFKKALELAPEDPGLKSSLKTIYTRLKNYDEAAKYN